VGRGEGRVVVLAGDAGVGKTRLASKLRSQAAKLGCSVIWGSCSASTGVIRILVQAEPRRSSAHANTYAYYGSVS
jgi:predicted ATP-dependent serine protease